MKKPAAATIHAAPPLTRERLLHCGSDPMAACNLCGQSRGELPFVLYREHDENDRPIHGTGALVFVAMDHKACLKRLNDHPRLYGEEQGNPGHFPRLCGECEWRAGTRCEHPILKANGGAGLYVRLDGIGAIICTRGKGCRTMVQHAVKCDGFSRDEEKSDAR